MFGNDHADIWLCAASGGPPRNITHGDKNSSGYWNPVWSPDGERLALLSTAGGGNIRAYVWDRRSGQLARVAERGVDLRSRTNATGESNPLQWVDGRRLLVTVLPEGEQPVDFRLRRQTPRIASEAWRKVAQGHEPTSSVLEGGVSTGPERANQLLLVDIVTMRKRVLAEGGIKYVLLSPDREHVAIVSQSRRPPPVPGKLLSAVGSAPTRLGIIALRGASTVQWVEGVFNPTVTFGAYSHRWSPRGSALAVLGSERADPDSPRAIFVISSSNLSVRKIAEHLAPSALAWSEGELLLARAQSPQGERADWWSLPSVPDEPRNLTRALTTVPTLLMRTHDANEMIGLADGQLWGFDVTTGSHRPLLDAGHPPVNALTWPAAEERVMATHTSLIVRIRERDADSLLRVDLSPSGSKILPFPQPPKATTFAGYNLERNLAVFSAPQDPQGTFLWTGAGGSSDFARRIALNEQLAGIAGGERLIISYRSTDGQELKAMLILPTGYHKGTQYPLVTWVYPGIMIRDLTSASDWTTLNHAHMDNLHILAGHGYAVLIPSMPTSVSLNERALTALTIGVLPAVDRVVELGIADTDRVAVMGQSGGGFVTYGLITQTTRFKAAVAISGPANHLTSYGVFSGETRYTNDVDEILPGSSEGRFGSPPWVDPDPYINSSPIIFMDRVKTPLLILHGDLDYVPIQHAEEVFTSLVRLGKRVRFVRYWGESHGVGDSPANVRDRWQQIFRWLDTYLRDG
jgi:dipeptidyl aminopeptidase/acylaminoacyl peptidase